MDTTKKEFLNTIYSGLKKHFGSQAEVARRRGCSYNWVRTVLLGNGNDDKVLAIAAEVLKEREDAKNNTASIIAATMSSIVI